MSMLSLQVDGLREMAVKLGVNGVCTGDLSELCVMLREAADTIESMRDRLQAAELGSERELIDLAHNAWSMALCAMQGMPIPAEWGNAVERGLRKYGIDVDEELAGFEEVDG